VSEVETTDAVWRDAVDRLAFHGVTYLTGGSEWDGREPPYACPDDAPPQALFTDLAMASEGRLRSAIVALLLRHPEYAPIAREVALSLPGGHPARRLLQVSVVVAAALQREWAFSLRLYLPAMARIEADGPMAALDLPSPDMEYGRTCLRAAAALLRAGAPFPYAYESDWEDVVHRMLAQLRREASRGA